MKTFHNYNTGIAVKIEPIAGGFGGHVLTHISFEADVPESNHVIEVRKYPAGKLGDAIAYAEMCVSDTVPAGTTLRVL